MNINLISAGGVELSNKKCILRLSGDLDYELNKFHTCVLEASDRAPEGSRLSSTINITIQVEDSNDNSPQFLGSYDDVNVSRQLVPGSNIMQINASDEDSGRNKQITFTLNNG